MAFIIYPGTYVGQPYSKNHKAPSTQSDAGLCTSAQRGILNDVKRYLRQGANKNCYNEYGNTPLGIAVSKGHTIVVEYLLKRGADVNAFKKTKGCPPISWAVRQKNIQLAKLLIRKDANVNLLDHKGNTPLINAVKSKYDKMVKFLIKSKADINICDSKGYSPLAIAVEQNDVNIVRILLQENADCYNGKPPLLVAFLKENLEIFNCLLKNRVDANLTDSSGSSLLSLALNYYESNEDFYTQAIKSLISRGANINDVDSDGNTVLMAIIKYQNEDLIKYLIEQDADVCKPNRNGKTPLAIAAEMNNIELATYLLDNGAEPTIQTAFMTAVQNNNLETVTLLKERGARVNYTSRNGETPFSTALDSHFPEITKFLTENGAVSRYYRESLIKAVESERFNLVESAVDAGADVNQVDGNGKSVLSIAASKSSFRIVKFLIDNGASIKLAAEELEEFAARSEDFKCYLEPMEEVVAGNGHEEDEDRS